MRKPLRMLSLASIALLLNWAQPIQRADAKEARPAAVEQYDQSDSQAGRQSDNQTESRSESSAESTSSEGASADESSLSSPKSEPHTLLYYAFQAIATLLGMTILLSLVGSANVIFLALVWQSIKLFNGGKKPEIG